MGLQLLRLSAIVEFIFGICLLFLHLLLVLEEDHVSTYLKSKNEKTYWMHHREKGKYHSRCFRSRKINEVLNRCEATYIGSDATKYKHTKSSK